MTEHKTEHKHSKVTLPQRRELATLHLTAAAVEVCRYGEQTGTHEIGLADVATVVAGLLPLFELLPSEGAVVANKAVLSAGHQLGLLDRVYME